LNRFLSSDPLGLAGGLNLYAYGENNPMTYIDPLGLSSQNQSAFGAGVGAFFESFTTKDHWIESGSLAWGMTKAVGKTAWNALQGFGDLSYQITTPLGGPPFGYDPVVQAQQQNAFYRDFDLVAEIRAKWNSGPEGKGELFGYGLITGGSIAAPFAKTSPTVKYIGKMDDLRGIPQNNTLLGDLPNLGSPKANYYQNSSVLRKSLYDGFEIRDASYMRPNWALDPTPLNPNRTVGQSFLGAERNILDNKGYFMSPNGVYLKK
jgi:hypothetical protein